MLESACRASVSISAAVTTGLSSTGATGGGIRCVLDAFGGTALAYSPMNKQQHLEATVLLALRALALEYLTGGACLITLGMTLGMSSSQKSYRRIRQHTESWEYAGLSYNICRLRGRCCRAYSSLALHPCCVKTRNPNTVGVRVEYTEF